MNLLSLRQKVLTMREIKTTLNRYMRYTQGENVTTRLVVRLSCCCGLRASEIARLRIKDVVAATRTTEDGGLEDVSYVHVASLKKRGSRPSYRIIPLAYDEINRRDLLAHRERRLAQCGDPDQLFLIGRLGQPLNRTTIRARFRTAFRGIGRSTSVHHGRHSFCSHLLAAGVNPVEVMQIMGHSSLSTTTIYAGVVERPQTVRDVFS